MLVLLRSRNVPPNFRRSSNRGCKRALPLFLTVPLRRLMWLRRPLCLELSQIGLNGSCRTRHRQARMQSDVPLSTPYLACTESTPIRMVGREDLRIRVHQLTQQSNACRPCEVLAWRNLGKHLPLPLSFQSSLLDGLHMSLSMIHRLTFGIATKLTKLFDVMRVRVMRVRMMGWVMMSG